MGPRGVEVGWYFVQIPGSDFCFCRGRTECSGVQVAIEGTTFSDLGGAGRHNFQVQETACQRLLASPFASGPSVIGHYFDPPWLGFQRLRQPFKMVFDLKKKLGRLGENG